MWPLAKESKSRCEKFLEIRTVKTRGQKNMKNSGAPTLCLLCWQDQIPLEGPVEATGRAMVKKWIGFQEYILQKYLNKCPSI